MKLQQAVNQYVADKRSLGMQCQTMARQLRAFCKASGDINVDEVGAHFSHGRIVRLTAPVIALAPRYP
jgi:hypothetical protein